jgi:hypothetical protein
MKIGIGLPNPVPDTEGATLVEWARLAEQAGFSSLATSTGSCTRASGSGLLGRRAPPPWK